MINYPELKVHETKKRSLYKAGSWRVLEVILETFILSKLLHMPPHLALGLAILLESLCFGLHFVFERAWNKIEYGRHILKSK